jgi:hypothetical protein
MRKTHLLAFAIALCGAQVAFAGPILIDVNTSSLAGTSGSIDFQFNPGAGTTQSATVSIVNFMGTGNYIGGSQQDVGAASGGPVPATLTITNTNADNEDFEGYHFGSYLEFNLSFSGPAVTSPSGTATSPTSFYFTVYSDLAGTNPALTSAPSGILAEVDVNPNGSFSMSTTSNNATFTPEPSSVWLVGGALLALGFVALRRRIA